MTRVAGGTPDAARAARRYRDHARLETHDARPVHELIRIHEEAHGGVRRALQRLGRNVRAPVFTLRWDPTAHGPLGGLRSQAFAAPALVSPPALTRLVARGERWRSPTLHVGAPVQVTVTNSATTNAQLGIPEIAGASAGASHGWARQTTIDGEAYGVDDPDVHIIAASILDPDVSSVQGRILVDVAFRYRVSPALLLDAYFGMFERESPSRVRSSTAEVSVASREAVEFDLDVAIEGTESAAAIVLAYGADDRVIGLSDEFLIRPAL